MKFDSYTRFVKSPLYQACLTAESQGQPLPDLRPHSRSSSPPPDLSKVRGVSRGHGPIPGPVTSLRDGDIVGYRAAPMLSFLLSFPQKSKLKLGKSLPLGVETAGSGANRSPRRSFRKGERREPSWAGRRRAGQLWVSLSSCHPHHGCLSVLDGGEGSGSAVLWRESQGSLNSSASLDLGFLSSASTAPSPWAEVSPRCAIPTPPLPTLMVALLSHRATARAWGAARLRPSP